MEENNEAKLKLSAHAYLCRQPLGKYMTISMIKSVIERILGEREDFTEFLPPFLLLASSEPFLFAPHVDYTKAKLAFGRLAIPKLRRQLLHKDETTVNQALGSLNDIVHDPELASEVLRLKVHIRLVRMMVSNREYVRQQTLMCLSVLANQAGGRLTLTENPYIVANLAKTLRDPSPTVRRQAVITLESFAHSWLVVRRLVNASYVSLTLVCILKDEHYPESIRILLGTLELLLDDGPDARVEAIAHDGMELVPMLQNEYTEIRIAAAGVMAQIFQHPIGQIAAVEHNVIPVLINGLTDSDELVTVEMSRALMFATVTTEGRKEAMKVGRVLDILMAYVTCYGSSAETKVHFLKCLTNLAELPSCRTRLRPHVSLLSGTYTHNSEVVCRCVRTLIETILWEP